MKIKNLYLIKEKLRQFIELKEEYFYTIPEIWLNPNTKNNRRIQINPFEYFLSQIEKIEEIALSSNEEINNLDNKIIYNSFARLTTAFNFDENDESEKFFRKTGTFLKTIALLPYLKKLNINIFYLLPTSKIGEYNHKGNLGSPYAIKNHFEFDSNLAEPFLNLSVDVQFAALVEACHLLGIKVVLEFIFRTASVDNDLIPIHPEWFYWVDEAKIRTTDFKLSPPTFEKDEITKIKEKIENNDFENLIEPGENYKKLFKKTPDKVIKEGQQYIGIYSDGSRAIVPNAFADWPPDDKQPTWDDVTYLKLYNNPKFNYIAYNTVRMYSNDILQNGEPQTQLWQYLEEIVPYYVNNYDIDGIMVDMGHSLPPTLLKNIVDKAKLTKPSFLLFEENFNIHQSSVAKGFDAVVGYLPFDIYNIQKIKAFIQRLSNEKLPISFFGTAENHNTPRTVNRFYSNDFSKLAFAIISFLPGIPFIHNGFEFFEAQPVNTGLDFSLDEINKFSSFDLPLFSRNYMNWLNQENLLEFITSFINFREKYKNQFQLKLIDISENLLIFKATHNNYEFIFGANFSKINQRLLITELTKCPLTIEFVHKANYYPSEKRVILKPLSFIILRIH